METKKKLSILMCCALIASVCTNAIAADEDGWTQADRTDAAADGAWDAWKTAWETEKTNFEHISLTPGKDETELNFAWYSKAESGTPEFKFYEKDGGEETAETVQVVQSDAIPGYYSNKVTVTGLEAGKIYCYSYTKDDGEWTDTEEYTAKDTTNGFSFVFMGDPQIGSSYANTRDDADDAQGQDLAVCNDSFNWNNTINKALGMNPDVNFIVSAGDQIQSRDKKTPEVTHESYTENEIEYAGYLLPEALKTLPVATTIGNHDSPSSNYTYHFNNPNVDETLGYTYAGTDYYFSYGNALFVMLNTNNTNAAEHKQLIEKAVEENGDKEWRIIMLHQDIYGPGEHSNEPEIVELRYSLMPIFEEYDIDVVLTGHDHAYSRSQIMKNAEISKYDWDTTAISTEDFEAVFGVDDPDEEQKARYDDYLAMI
ncbi:MAG: metallophosphoesterase, partial [Candidatus Ornithomonoglobus sp.]